jgi:hypothetical protein
LYLSPLPTFATQTGVTERMLPLMDGALLTKRLAGDVWSYPDIHGDVVATANASGLKSASPFGYEPFVEVIGSARTDNCRATSTTAGT